MIEEKVKQNRNLLIVGIICLVGIIGIVGYTYSFFQVKDTDTGSIVGTVASTSLEVEVEKLVPSTNVGLVPQLDEYITSAVVGRNNKNCVDDNGNEVCQVYSITVTNTSSVSIKVDGLVELNANNNPNLKWAEITGYTLNMTTKPTLASSYNSHTTKTLTASEEYTKNQEKTYYIVVWISETNDAQEDTGVFTGTVTFKLADNDSPALTTLTSLNIAPNADVPSFDKTSCSSGCGENTVGVYSYQDDLGTSYYFRGDVENNYVKFDNKYWRIIRINGDGTIRMIYDGTVAHANGDISSDRQITTKFFNGNYNDNTYVGYMFGTAGANTYTATHSNTTDSTIKDYLENTWYPTISEANKEYIVDAIYCNDRSLSSGTGIGTTTSDYAPNQRLYRNKAPVLTCSQSNDRFTLESSNFVIETNGMLDAPVGLITVDEVALAGGKLGTGNSEYYLYIGDFYWTMSPLGTSSVNGLVTCNVYIVNWDGALNGSYLADPFLSVRVVISLNSTAITSGNGAMTDPFVVG